MESERTRARSVGGKEEFPPRLEECNPSQLEKVATTMAPGAIAELRELYDLVARVKAEIPDYRVRSSP